MLGAFANTAKETNYSNIALFRVSNEEGFGKASSFSIEEITSSREMNAELR